MDCRSLCDRLLRFLRIRRGGEEELPPVDEIHQIPKSVLDPTPVRVSPLPDAPKAIYSDSVLDQA